MKKRWMIIGCIIVAIVSGVLGSGYLLKKSPLSPAVGEEPQKNLLPPGAAIEYRVKPEKIKDKRLSVSIRIFPADSFKGHKFSLDKGTVDILDSKCTDQTGHTVPAEDKEGIVRIGPIGKDAKYIDYTYRVKVGEYREGKKKGELYEDLLVFSGENVLLFPYFDPASKEDMAAVDKYISKVSIQVEGEKGWNAAMPYQQTYNTKQDSPVVIENPDWNVFFNLSKSCYAFGKFESLPIETKDGYTVFLVDSACKDKLTAENVNAMERLYNYYAQIFGKGLDNYAVILLRRELSQDAVILGGVGGKTLGLSLGMNTGDDWYTFSHSLYHAFFDSKIHAKNLHYAPNLWLYKGLADYYVDRSADVLPDSIKKKCGIQSRGDLQSIYTRYLYFALKDPALLKLSPAHETRNLIAKDAFYYGTKVPLIIDAIEKTGRNRKGAENHLITTLMGHANDKDIDMGSFMVEVLGKDEVNIRNYFTGEDIIPFLGSKPGKEDREKIILELDEYERMLAGWYQTEAPEYPYDPVAMLKPGEILREAQMRKLKFNSDEIQAKVKDYSETVYILLMQNALRADICGEKDLSALDLKLKLNRAENIKKWQEFANRVGFYAEK